MKVGSSFTFYLVCFQYYKWHNWNHKKFRCCIFYSFYKKGYTFDDATWNLLLEQQTMCTYEDTLFVQVHTNIYICKCTYMSLSLISFCKDFFFTGFFLFFIWKLFRCLDHISVIPFPFQFNNCVPFFPINWHLFCPNILGCGAQQ